MYDIYKRRKTWRTIMAADKKSKLTKKPLPPDAIAKGPNKKVPINKLLDDCAG
jgi:hypothetical protein